MNFYYMKRAVLAPYIAYMRHQERHQNAFIKRAFELQSYSPAFYRFLGASKADPGMLSTAPLGPESVVLDVGAHEGYWAAQIFQKYRCRVFGFEPDPENFSALSARVHGNEKIRVFDFGLYDRDATLDLTQKGMGSTFFDEGLPLPTRPNVLPARVRDAATVLDELGVKWIDLLKINIEGSEFELLDRLIETAWMCRVRCLMVQFHEWRSGAHLRRLKIRHALRRTHVENWNYAFVWEKWSLR